MPEQPTLIAPLLLYLVPMIIGLAIRRPKGWGIAYSVALLLPMVNLAAVVMALRQNRHEHR